MARAIDGDELLDIEKLIERLYQHDKDYGEGRTQDFFRVCLDCKDAATALSTLQAENEKLRAELERVTAERDAAISDLTYIARTYPVDLCDDLVCQYCKHYPNVNTGCPGWTDNDCFEWRGMKED